MENTTHTQTEIAKAIMSRAGLRTPPYAVDLAPQECQECGGEGFYERITGGWEIPSTRRERCPKCFGVGEVIATCNCCCQHSASVVQTYGSPALALLCEECATDTTFLDGLDYVVAFALRVLP